MIDVWFPLLLTIPAAILLAAACCPDRWANGHPRTIRRFVTLIATLQFIVASCGAIALVAGWLPLVHSVLASLPTDLPIAATIYYDGVTSLMLLLVSFVGWVICQYSIRYLDGEATQGRYFRWTSFTIGAVSLMVISGNLLMFIIAWVMTSLGLHQLLLHYGHRPAARRAAWTKFAISRLGDAALIAAMVIIYSQFKTLDFAELFVAVGSVTGATVAMQVASCLLVVGAITKSAQIPFHTWLPQTLETPTPVSALMHAGIVNAGGYLIIRTSPLVALAPWALTALAIIGGVTACLAAVVMLTQTSVKKSLAYSTIAQMGFMLMQCGLGAFSAAMLHILAHSLYKAHAFLSSGSVIAERTATYGGLVPDRALSLGKLVAAGSIVVASLALAFAICGLNPVTKPGGLLLGGIISLALTHWVGQAMRTGSRPLVLRAFAVAGGLCLVYSASFITVEKIIGGSLPVAQATGMFELSTGIILIGFVGMFTLHAMLATGRGSALLNKWHIHASNGFYFESLMRRALAPLLSGSPGVYRR